MKKLSLISLAVLTAFSVSTTSLASSISTSNGSLTIGQGELVYDEATGTLPYDEITIVGGSNKQLQTLETSEKDVVSTVNMTGNQFVSSYIKHYGEELQIHELTVKSGSILAGAGTLEFWGENGKKQSITVDTVSLETNSFLKIQESTWNDDINPTSSVKIGNLLLSDKSALGLGSGSYNEGQESATDKDAADVVSIDHVNLMSGTAAIATIGETASGVLQIGTIDVGDATLVFSGSEDDLPEGVTLPSELPSVAKSGITLVGQDQVNGDKVVKADVKVNMNSATSQLILGNVGENDADKATTLDVVFSQEAYEGDAKIAFGQSATIAEGTNLDLTAVNAAKGTTAENVAVLQTLADKVTTPEGQQFASTEVKATSDVFDAVSASLNEKGEVDQSTIASVENAEVMGFAQLHSVGVMQWREEMNHM